MMTTAVLRVSGEQLDVEQCLAWIPQSLLEAVWHIGENRVGGGLHRTSGFTILLADGDNNQAVVDETVKAFGSLAQQVALLVQAGATAEIDFAMMVTGLEAGTQSLRFGTELLGLVDRCGLSVVVSAYPSSDDDEDED